MPELGALSLRIETLGDKDVLRVLSQVTKQARDLDAENTKQSATVRRLNKEITDATRTYALMGRTADLTNKETVAGLRQVAASQREYIQTLGATDQQLLQWAATEQAVERRIAAAHQQVTLFGTKVTNAQGNLVGFGRSGLTAFNAIAFGLSQMAATGTASFRSLATASASALAFFGPQGALASAILSTGLVFADFFSRTRRGMEDLVALGEKLTKDAIARRERDEPAQVAQEQLDKARQALAAIDAQIQQTAKRKLIEGGSEFPLGTPAQLAARFKALQDITEAERQLNDAIAKQTKGLAEVKVTTESVEKAEQRRIAALNDLVAALVLANKENLFTLDMLPSLASAHAAVDAELQRGNLTLAERVKLLKQAADLADVALGRGLTAPGLAVTPSRQTGAKGAAGKIVLSDQDRRNLGLKDALTVQLEAEAAQVQEALSNSLADALVNGIADGFARAAQTGNVGEGIKAIFGSIASGLGSIFIQIGKQVIASSALIQGAVAAINSLNPVAALAAGLALVAFGSSIGGSRGGGGGGRGGGAGYGGGSSAYGAGSISSFIYGPNAKSPLDAVPAALRSTVAGLRNLTQPTAPTLGPNLTVIGVDSPQGVALLGRSHRLATQRGF